MRYRDSCWGVNGLTARLSSTCPPLPNRFSKFPWSSFIPYPLIAPLLHPGGIVSPAGIKGRQSVCECEPCASFPAGARSGQAALGVFLSLSPDLPAILACLYIEISSQQAKIQRWAGKKRARLRHYRRTRGLNEQCQHRPQLPRTGFVRLQMHPHFSWNRKTPIARSRQCPSRLISLGACFFRWPNSILLADFCRFLLKN